MFEFTESIAVQASPTAVWELMRDVERWWLASNPEHDSLVRLDGGGDLGVGARLRIRERIGGIPGEAVGEITRFDPPSAVTWEAPEARYRWLGLSVPVGEGVTWTIEPGADGSTIIGARVWATFPPGLGGRLLEWGFRLLGGIQKDRQHTRTELDYLKRIIEEGDADPRASER